MSEVRYRGIDIELNLYQRAGSWTGQYILIKRSGSQILNEVNSISDSGDTQEEARALALREARRSIDRFETTAPILFRIIANR
jgi:hypothetical protein